MHKWIAWCGALLLAAGALAAIGHQRPLGPNPVIVELFTSQG